MNRNRYILGSIVIFAFIFIYEFALHGVLLKSQYEGVAFMFREEGETPAFFVWIGLAQLIFALAFCFIFTKGYENKGLGEGFRYGLLMALLISLPMGLYGYALHPMPVKLVTSQVIGGFVEMICAGLIIAGIYKPKSA